MDWHKQSRRCAPGVTCLPPELALAKLLGQNCWGKIAGAKLLGQNCWGKIAGAKLLG